MNIAQYIDHTLLKPTATSDEIKKYVTKRCSITLLLFVCLPIRIPGKKIFIRQ